jgi:hypothetical protein
MINPLAILKIILRQLHSVLETFAGSVQPKLHCLSFRRNEGFAVGQWFFFFYTDIGLTVTCPPTAFKTFIIVEN